MNINKNEDGTVSLTIDIKKVLGMLWASFLIVLGIWIGTSQVISHL